MGKYLSKIVPKMIESLKSTEGFMVYIWIHFSFVISLKIAVSIISSLFCKLSHEARSAWVFELIDAESFLWLIRLLIVYGLPDEESLQSAKK